MKTDRHLKVAAISGGLDWSYRTTCSGDKFDRQTAESYIREYTEQQIARVRQAADQGAGVVVGQEYFFGAEMFIAPSETDRTAIAEKTDGESLTALRELCKDSGIVFCCSGNVDHGPNGVQETGILIDEAGQLSIQAKHPRRVPDPDDWPFDSRAKVYATGTVRVGMTVCSDCTHDPYLPLEMSRLGMELLLLPGCGFMGEKWEHFLIVRARDTQCPIVYADDRRAAIASSAGDLVNQTDQAGEIIFADLEIVPKKNSPDATHASRGTARGQCRMV